jgi:cytochrome c oxidase cbb3-type subunit IV
MYKDILRSIAGIDVFPVVSLVIFVAVFTAAIVYAIRLDRARLAALSALPLDDPDATSLRPSGYGRQVAVATSEPVESRETCR